MTQRLVSSGGIFVQANWWRGSTKNQLKTYLQTNVLFLVIFRPKFLSTYAQIYSKKLVDIFNESTKMGKFPDILKNVEATPIFKKDDMNDKQNYCPVSTLDWDKMMFCLALNA